MVISAFYFLDRLLPGSLIPLPHAIVSPEVQSRKEEGKFVGDALDTTLLPSFLLCS